MMEFTESNIFRYFLLMQENFNGFMYDIRFGLSFNKKTRTTIKVKDTSTHVTILYLRLSKFLINKQTKVAKW